MNADFNDLNELRSSRGYQLLLGLWAIQGQKILEASRRAARKPQESAWRFYAGQQEGFELAIGEIDRALTEMQQKSENQVAQIDIDKTLAEIKARGGPS